MRCISLWQPWASLIAVGAKKIETRSWATSYRGPLLIHASKNRNRDALYLCSEQPFCAELLRGGIRSMSDLPFGAIVCRCELVDCVNTDDMNALDYLMAIERSFGDFSHGRFAWKLDNIVQLKPIPYTGRQGLFEVPDVIVPA